MSRIYQTLGTVAPTPKGDYDASAYYEYLNIVDYQGSSYMAKQSAHGILPTNENYWLYLGGGVKRGETVLSFDNVAAMKASTLLGNGMVAQTSGYYSSNDGGSAQYLIRTKTNEDVVDEGSIIALHSNTLVAELIINNEMNVKQFGAKGDGTTDETDKFKIAISKCDNLFIPEGEYLITDQIQINDSSKVLNIYGNGNCNIKINISETYKRFIYGYLFDTITYKGLKFEGLTTETSVDNTFPTSIGLTCRNGKNVNIENCYFKSMRYCYLGEQNRMDPANEYLVENINIKNNIAYICSCFINLCCSDKILVDNNHVTELIPTGGGSGSAHIYIRPNIENLIITNNYLEGCTGDSLHNNRFDADTPYPSDMTSEPVSYMYVANNTFKNIGNLIGFNSFNDKVIIENNIIENSSNKMITSYKGYCNQFTFNNNVVKGFYRLIYKESVTNDQYFDLMNITNNKFYNGTINDAAFIDIQDKVNNFVLDSNYFENYQKNGNTASAIRFDKNVGTITISNNIFKEDVSETTNNFSLIVFRSDLATTYAIVDGNKTIGASKVNVFVYSPKALTRLYVTNNILHYCSNLTTGNATVIQTGNIRNGEIVV